jgi:hypothetical protein
MACFNLSYFVIISKKIFNYFLFLFRLLRGFLRHIYDFRHIIKVPVQSECVLFRRDFS